MRLMTPSSTPLRIGILSTANIGRAFVKGVQPSSAVTIVAVASRDGTKAKRFAAEVGIPRAHDSYEALLADREIDAIYNPLPNSLHAEWSIRSVEAGKHVLCEKPLAATAAEARAMFEAAKRHGVYLVEGYPYRAQPQTLKLRELLDAGALGRVQLIQASFGFTMSDGSNIRLDPSLAGGALMDVGSYPVSLARMVAKERPFRVNALAQWTDSGVDRTLVATIEFPSGLLAQISCSFATALHRQALIAGTEGVLQTTFFNNPSPATPPILHLRRGKGSDATAEILEVPTTNGFLGEAESFARLVRQGPEQWTGASPEESVDIMLTLEALLHSARTGKRVDIDAPP
jgi:D-xylose 1-dehydrogenase (NADP+, D-xylono-1,5-lactone-forming)